MITKYPRPNEEGQYNLRVTDAGGKSYVMQLAGNLDLYWIPEKCREDNITFTILKTDELLYKAFDELFKDIEKYDDKYEPSLIGNTFTFISEDRPEEYANRLKIVKEDDRFNINFIKNQDAIGGFTCRGCAIHFCNSGSRVPRIETLFMKMFTDFAYYNQDIAIMQK